MQIPETNAGWYPDPDQPGTLRYWDGAGWTDQRAPLPVPQPLSPRSDGPSVGRIAMGVFLGLVLAGFLGGILVACENQTQEAEYIDCLIEGDSFCVEP